MDRRKDQIILVEQRRPGLVAGRIWRIERQLRQESTSLISRCRASSTRNGL
jgi:hypothetical protein